MHDPYFHINFSKKINAHKTSFCNDSPILYFVANPYKWIILLARFPWFTNFIFHLYVYHVATLNTTFVHGAWNWTLSLPSSLTPCYTIIYYNGILSIMYLHRAFVIEIGGICTLPMNKWDILIEHIIYDLIEYIPFLTNMLLWNLGSTSISKQLHHKPIKLSEKIT